MPAGRRRAGFSAGTFCSCRKYPKTRSGGGPPVRLRPAARALLTGGPPPENPLIAGGPIYGGGSVTLPARGAFECVFLLVPLSRFPFSNTSRGCRTHPAPGWAGFYSGAVWPPPSAARHIFFTPACPQNASAAKLHLPGAAGGPQPFSVPRPRAAAQSGSPHPGPMRRKGLRSRFVNWSPVKMGILKGEKVRACEHFPP